MIYILYVMFDKKDNVKLIDFGFVSLKKNFKPIDMKISLQNL